jgi:broad specificity phosphatase PhoE
MRLLVARHGATQHNLDARFTGQIDAPLSTLGLRQAEALAARLADAPFDAIVSSDLSRARVTAERIARFHHQPVLVDADLREINMGRWEGRTVADVRREWPGLLDRVEYDPTGETTAPDGESWARFVARVGGALERWQARFPQGRVLWVAHGGVMSALMVRALGMQFTLRHQFARGNASLFEIEYGHGDPLFLRINDTSHLDGLANELEGEVFQAL